MASRNTRVGRLERTISELAGATDGVVTLIEMLRTTTDAPVGHGYQELLAAVRELIGQAKGQLPDQVPPSAATPSGSDT